MFKKVVILEQLLNGFNRFFKSSFGPNETKNALQYHSGGEDFNPPINTEAIGGYIAENPANAIIIAYKDKTERKAAPGEKRIYATDETGENVVSEIHLKNNGDVVIYATGKIITTGELEHTGPAKLTGNVQIIGELTASVIKAENGASGTLDKPEVTNGIVTGGS